MTEKRGSGKKLQISSNIDFFRIFYSAALFLTLLFEEKIFVGTKFQGRWTYLLYLFLVAAAAVSAYFRNKTLGNQLLGQYGYLMMTYIPVILWSVCVVVTRGEMPVTEVLRYTLYWITPVLLSFSAFLLMGEKSVDVTMDVLIVNYLVLIMAVARQEGIGYFFRLKTYTDNYASPLEVHQIGLTVPLILLYYLYLRKEQGRKPGFRFAAGLIVALLCGKKIALLGFLVVLILYFFLRSRNTETEVTRLLVTGLLILICIVLYLLAIDAGIIQGLLNLFGINSNTRIETWAEFKKYYELLPWFMGRGIGFTSWHLKQNGGIWIGSFLIRAADMHNDILKMFLECGFIPYFWFMIRLTVGNQLFFLRKNAEKTALYVTLAVAYTVILMLTDNIMRYSFYLLMFTMTITTVYIAEQNKKSLKASEKDILQDVPENTAEPEGK